MGPRKPVVAWVVGMLGRDTDGSEISGGGAGMICCWTGLMVTSSPGLRLDFVRLLKHFSTGAAAG